MKKFNDKPEKKITCNEVPKDMPVFEWTDDSITLTGKAIPEFAAQSWTPFILELEEFFNKQILKSVKREKFTVNFKLDYYNSSSNAFISKMFDILQKNSNKRDCVVNWYYFEADDDGAGDDGEMYRDSSLYKKVAVNLIIRYD